jgi:hypothetical protein
LLPTFLIIGSAKAATTTLWSILNQHPDVFVPELKEPNYLLGGTWASRGRSWYESLFADGAGVRHRGEASPAYSMFPMFPGVPERAAELVPEVRIIYMIRHPVRRMVSHWTQATTAGHEHRPLQDALVWASAYHFTSCYGLQLSRWAKAFPLEALLVLRSEDLDSDPEGSIDRVLEHLRLDRGWRPTVTEMRENASTRKPRSPRPVIRAAGALRGAGLERAAQWLAKRTPFKERAGLLRPYRPSELELDPAHAEALLECFRADFGLLRQLVGPELDLYGLA